MHLEEAALQLPLQVGSHPSSRSEMHQLVPSRLLLYRPPDGVDDPNTMGVSMVARRGLTTLMRIEGWDHQTSTQNEDDDDDDDDDVGDADGVLSGVQLANLTLAHADWALPGDTSGDPPGDASGGQPNNAQESDGRMADWQAAAFLTDAALVVRHATRTQVRNVQVCHVGGYAVWLADGARRSTVYTPKVQISGLSAEGQKIRIDERSTPRRCA